MAEAKVNLSEEVRKVLKAHKGKITFSEAKPEFEKLGIEVSASLFNINKNRYRKEHGLIGDGRSKSKGSKATKTAKAIGTNGTAKVADNGTINDAVAFVQECGGLTAARERLKREQALIEQIESLSA